MCVTGLRIRADDIRLMDQSHLQIITQFRPQQVVRPQPKGPPSKKGSLGIDRNLGMINPYSDQGNRAAATGLEFEKLANRRSV